VCIVNRREIGATSEEVNWEDCLMGMRMRGQTLMKRIDGRARIIFHTYFKKVCMLRGVIFRRLELSLVRLDVRTSKRQKY